MGAENVSGGLFSTTMPRRIHLEVRHMCAMNPELARSEDQDRSYPIVSIVIPVYNGASTIRLCLDAILSQDFPREQYEVIVVDNNSTDGTPEIVKQYPVLLLYERELQGPHAATNTGVRQAKGEIMAFTDSDCVPEPRWLRLLVEAFADEEVIVAGGRIEAYRPTSRVERFLGEEIRPFNNCLRMSETFPACVITGNAAYRADAFRKVGLFDANMYTGAEVDFGWRVQWATGKKAVYVPDAVVYHKFSPGVRRLFRHFRIYGYSEITLGTVYKDRGYPRSPKVQLRVMVSQFRALFTYIASFGYRFATARLRGQDMNYVTSPLLWLVAETGSLCGKLEALWLTRCYRKQFWLERQWVI
jgi:cellulose synthase/poly-beta-1,6-N-acetylglucosamine synthase-like glycosyltransferase